MGYSDKIVGNILGKNKGMIHEEYKEGIEYLKNTGDKLGYKKDDNPLNKNLMEKDKKATIIVVSRGGK